MIPFLYFVINSINKEYQYLMNVDSTSRKELMKLQLYQTIGVPPALIELFSAKASGAALQPCMFYPSLPVLQKYSS